MRPAERTFTHTGRLGRALAAATIVAAGVTAGAAPAAAQGAGSGGPVPACDTVALRPGLTRGPVALRLQALALSDRVVRGSPLRHRASERLGVVVCPADPDAPGHPGDTIPRVLPGARREGLSAFGALEIVGNSGYARGGNDGALWQGRGASGLLRAGAAGGWRFFSAALAPELVFWQNAAFDLRGEGSDEASTFRNPWHTLDLPERPGADAGVALFPGQSWARVDLGPLAAGVSSANIRFGAARHFPLLLGGAAPGFPHGFLGTSGPVRLGPLILDFEVFAGELRESDHYDDIAANDRRALIGTHLATSLAPIPGLWLGVLRVYTDYITDDRALGEIFRDNALDTPWVEGDDNNAGNGLASLLFFWGPPGTGFELYGEYAREDYPYNLLDVAREPDWTRAYTLGVSKRFAEGVFATDAAVLVNAELANLSVSNPERAGKGWFSYYTHSRITQGHTHRGQLLGAWIGPGSTAQRLSMDVLGPDGLVGGYLQRVAYDEDAYYRTWSLRYGGVGHDVELTAAAHVLRPALGGALWLELGVSHRWNRGFVALGPDGATSSEWNLGLEAQLLRDW